MSAFPNIGQYVPTLTGLSPQGVTSLADCQDKWVITYNNPSFRSSQIPQFFRSYSEFKNNNIELMRTTASDSAPSVSIISPDQILRAKFYMQPNKPFTHDYLIRFIDRLKDDYRPESHGLPTGDFNPNCPDIEKIVGEYVLGSPQNVDPYLLDFVIYAFALIKPDGTLYVYSEKQLQELADLRYSNPDLKVIMAIGGWAADGFSDAALTPASRYSFAREAKRWVDEYNLDGIDIDWEYPGSSASGIKSRKEDRENFTLLLEALRDVLGPTAWLSVAGSGDASYIRNVDIAGISNYIDYFNLMAYDFTSGQTGVTAERHQSNLYPSPLALNNTSVSGYINNLIQAGMPPEKILMGLPLYGRGGNITKTFDEIRKNYLNKNGYKVKWDNVAKAPYIIYPSGDYFLGYDNSLSIYFKGQYVLDNCLGGLFTWHSNMDKGNILSNAMSESIKDPGKLEDTLSKAYYGK